MNIDGLGLCEKDDDNIYYSEEIFIEGIDSFCEFIIEGYDADDRKEEFEQAIHNFLTINKVDLEKAEPHIYRYYQDTIMHDGKDKCVINLPAEVWSYISFGFEVYVRRRDSGDKAVYLSFECNCDWESEHGLQLVFRNGNDIAKVGQFDGHLSNADAYADVSLEGVIYHR